MNNAKPVGEIITNHSELFKKNLTLTQKASLSWNKIAGKIGQKHTQGIFVKETDETEPILFVYLDSSALIQDFQTNAVLYKEKLAMIGFPVEKILFKLSNKKAQKQESREKQNTTQEKNSTLSKEEEQYIVAISKTVTGDLQNTLKNALIALRKSELREKHEK